jgi:hypothetical protein
MATALGAAMLLYFVLSRRLAQHEDSAGSPGGGAGGGGKRRRGRAVRRPAQPPATWIEAVGTLAETLRFTYAETLGKWPIGDLAFGIKYLMRRQVRPPYLTSHRHLAARIDTIAVVKFFKMRSQPCVLDPKWGISFAVITSPMLRAALLV